MRLEDWQKWLDSQFVDTSSDPSTEVGGESVETAAPLWVHTEPQASHVSVEIVDGPLPQPPSLSMSSNYSNEPGPLVNSNSIQHAIDPLSAAVTAQPAASTPSNRPDPEPVTQDDASVPSIENYLPFLRTKHDSAIDPAGSPSDIPLHNVNTVGNISGAEIQRPDPVEPPVVLAALPQPMLDEPPAPARRFGPSSRRSKSAKHLHPAKVAAPMDADEVWSLVPRHLNTLMAISDSEVAQHSYKRDFRETRVDLIQRLLDPTLTLEETARLLNVCPTTVRRYTNRGLLRHQRTPGDQRRFKLSDVLSFLETQGQPGPQP